MRRSIEIELRGEGLRPADYFVAESLDEGETTYFGVAPKSTPYYRRHYIVDSENCGIRAVWADQ